jgi:hypothetical protein
VPSAPPPVTRRTATGAVTVGLLAVAGCDLDDLDPRSDPSSPGTPTASAPADADSVLVAGVVDDLGVMLGEVTGAAQPDRRTFRHLARLHRRHLVLLDASTEVAAAGGAVLSAVTLTRHEERLQRRLATASVAAGSGELARVLASMSAAVAQQLALLPAAAP